MTHSSVAGAGEDKIIGRNWKNHHYHSIVRWVCGRLALLNEFESMEQQEETTFTQPTLFCFIA